MKAIKREPTVYDVFQWDGIFTVGITNACIGDGKCTMCGHPLVDHGDIQGSTVCPGDWIIREPTSPGWPGDVIEILKPAVYNAKYVLWVMCKCGKMTTPRVDGFLAEIHDGSMQPVCEAARRGGHMMQWWRPLVIDKDTILGTDEYKDQVLGWMKYKDGSLSVRGIGHTYSSKFSTGSDSTSVYFRDSRRLVVAPEGAPDPGEGYRLAGKDESPLPDGSEWHHSGDLWVPCGQTNCNNPYHDSIFYRVPSVASGGRGTYLLTDADCSWSQECLSTDDESMVIAGVVEVFKFDDGFQRLVADGEETKWEAV